MKVKRPVVRDRTGWRRAEVEERAKRVNFFIYKVEVHEMLLNWMP